MTTNETPEPEPVPLTDEERAAQNAEADAAVGKLTTYGLLITALAIAAAGIAWKLGIPGAEGFTKGVAVGGLISVLNLRVLAKALWSLMSGAKLTPMLGLGASFGLLISVAYWLVVTHESWVMGFGIGLALPAPAGVWFALRQASPK